MATEREKQAVYVQAVTSGEHVTPIEWQPNFIDARHSRVIVDARRDRGEHVPVCGRKLANSTAELCGVELDVDPVPHHPRCPAIHEGGGSDG